MVGVMGIVAAVMQFVRQEDPDSQLFQLFAPLIFICLPVMVVVGCLAILFEAIPWLRGGLGNVVYFFLWIGALSTRVAGLASAAFAPTTIFSAWARSCLPWPQPVKPPFPVRLGKTSLNLGINFKGAGQYWDLTTFRWEGLDWTREIILGRLFWLGVGLGLALLAALFFRRFDPAREGSSGRASRRGRPRNPKSSKTARGSRRCTPRDSPSA